jgi:hypothetical protein
MPSCGLLGLARGDVPCKQAALWHTSVQPLKFP